LANNVFIDKQTNLPIPIPRDSVAQVTMADIAGVPLTFDMSDTGYIFRFFVNVEADGDLINRNDRYEVDVLSQIVGGRTGLSPDPSNRRFICFGTSVELRARDYFGQIKWEEKLIRPDGTGEWFPGIFRPDDQRDYIPAPDSTTDYRVRVCGSAVVSDSFRIEVIKPAAPKALNFSICGDTINDWPLRYGAVVQDFISGVYAYDSAFQSIRNGALIPDGFFSFPLNFDANDGFQDTLIRTRLGNQTDTAYLEAFVNDPRVDNGINNGRCHSINKAAVYSTINTIPSPNYTLDSVNVCQDTSLLLDGGKVRYAAPDEDGNVKYYPTTYAWTIFLPNGTVVDTSTSDSSVLRNQTMVVDAYLLDKDKTYGYALSMTTDSGCSYLSTGIKWITITDSCVTSIEEVSFKESFTIYPNPVTQDVFITHESVENFKGSIKLMSVEGQIIEAINEVGFGRLNQKIDMRALPKGIYIIKVETEKGAFVEKIIKS